MAVGVKKPAGGEEISSICFECVVYSHPYGIGQAGDGFLALKAVGGCSQGQQDVGGAVGPQQDRPDMFRRFQRAGDAFFGVDRSVPPTGAPPKDQTFDIESAGRLIGIEKADKTGGTIGSVGAGKDRDAALGDHGCHVADHGHPARSGRHAAAPALQERHAIMGFTDQFDETITCVGRPQKCGDGQKPVAG